jgi:HPt (histidine-containing phosphotransfer) domain-containing protein
MPNRQSLLDELIALFMADLPRRLGAIAQAIGRGDGRTLALNAHALRGGAANFGAARLDDLCGALEDAGARGALETAPALLEAIERESARVREALAAAQAKYAAERADGAGARVEATQKSSGNSR